MNTFRLGKARSRLAFLKSFVLAVEQGRSCYFGIGFFDSGAGGDEV